MQLFNQVKEYVERVVKGGLFEAITPDNIKVAVVGGQNSGKTVFITSLIDHLMHHNDERFDLAGWNVVNPEISWDANGGDSNFEYYAFRKQLAGDESSGMGFWPRKTKDHGRIQIKVTLTKGANKSKVKILDIMDIPGERVADMSMYRRSYKAWCKSVESYFAELCGKEFVGVMSRYADFVDAVNRAIEAEPVDEELMRHCFDIWKSIMVEFYSLGQPNIMPSTLRLGLDGKVIAGRPNEYAEKIRNIPLGLGVGEEFVPLPIKCFKDSYSSRIWTERFEKSYENYKKTVVNPVCDWLYSVDCVVYLVDVTGILGDGPARLNAERNMAKLALGDVFSNGVEGALKQLGVNLANCFRGHHVYRLFTVATKCDLISDDSRENICRLLKSMLDSITNGLGVRIVKAVPCAAVRTTIPGEIGSDNKVFKEILADGREECVLDALRVPSEWPDSWNWPAFDFYETLPRFDLNNPPKQFGLDEITRGLLFLD